MEQLLFIFAYLLLASIYFMAIILFTIIFTSLNEEIRCYEYYLKHTTYCCTDQMPVNQSHSLVLIKKPYNETITGMCQNQLLQEINSDDYWIFKRHCTEIQMRHTQLAKIKTAFKKPDYWKRIRSNTSLIISTSSPTENILVIIIIIQFI